MNSKINENYNFINIYAHELSEKELKECSELYSNNYGFYSQNSKKNPGQQIKLSVSYYKNNFCNNKNYRVSLVYKNNKLAGMAFYTRKANEKKQTTNLIIQLVVDKNTRREKIASRLMQSIWGFTDDFAWGIITPNPCTVKTLESVTYRKCNPFIIKNNLSSLDEVLDTVHYLSKEKIYVSDNFSKINTEFFVDRKDCDIKTIYDEKWELGDLDEGYEWFAFTFKDQKIDSKKFKKHFSERIKFSENILKEAYSRMEIDNQSWTKGTQNEINTILSEINLDNSEDIKILDIGCGTGRHSIELAKKGYKVKGLDFSKQHINSAKTKAKSIKNLSFECKDIKSYTTKNKYNMILCLYDVIGSYPDNKDNVKIIKKAYKLIKENGYFVLSVMNMELTEHIVPNSQKGDIENNPEILYELLPSPTMMKTGNIFNPKYLAIDTKNNIVYRKEQFSEDRQLPVEHIIRDKRFSMNEITKILEDNGFEIKTNRYVQAAKFDIPLSATDKKAKEIFIICTKK